MKNAKAALALLALLSLPAPALAAEPTRSAAPGSPGMGAGGVFEPYERSPELDAECAKYGLRAFWFRRDLPPEGTPEGDRIRALNARAAAPVAQADRRHGGKRADNALPERIPFLLFLPDPAACTGAVPLVVYLPGNGEQGTDLRKQFRQTACIARATSPAFQASHPAALLVPMPPDWGDRNISAGFPRDPFGPQAELFCDLALAVARGAPALGGPAIDPARIHLTGLGTGANIAAGMAFDHPGRFASVSGAWFSPHCDPSPRVPGAWWIAQEDKDRDEDERLEWEEVLDHRIRPFGAAVRAAGGAFEYREYKPLPGGGWWWDRMWRDDDAFWDWLFAQRSGGEIDPEDAASVPRFLFGASAGADPSPPPPAPGDSCPAEFSVLALQEGLVFGARVDATLRVGIDDPATPAAGARGVWDGARSTGERLGAAALPSGTAGADGVLRLRGLCLDGDDPFSPVYLMPAGVRVTAPGAWGRRFSLEVGAPSGGTWRVSPQPGEAVAADGTLLLRGVRRPAPLALSELAVPCGDFPAEGVGYDAAKGAFLPPLGVGETADFFVEAGRTAAMPGQPAYAWLVLRPAPGGAFLLERDRWDDLRTPREAPADGWSAEPLRFVFRSPGHTAAPRAHPLRGLYPRHEVVRQSADETPAGRVILFRSRPDGASAPGPRRFRHGAVVPPRAFALDGNNVFGVRFNPEPGDRSLEPLSGLRLPPPPPAADAAPPAPPPAAPLGEGPLLAALAPGGETALFLGAEAQGAFAPPTFPATVRFAPGAAGKTPLAAVRTLVVPHFAPRVPARAFAGLPELRCAVLEGFAGLGPGAFADCPRLEAALFDAPPGDPIPPDAFAGAAPGFAAFLGAVSGIGRNPGDEASLPRADGAPPLPARVVGFRGEDGWDRPFLAGGLSGGLWSLDAGRAEYRGPRVDGGVLWMPFADDGAAVLHRADSAGPAPTTLGGRRVVGEAELGRRRGSPLRWEWPAPGEAAVAGFFARSMPPAFDGPLEIPAELPCGARVVAIADGAFSPLSPDPRDDPATFAGRDDAWWRTNAVDLVVREGVRRIGARAFAGFAPLRSVRLPSTLETIGREAFADCIALERIELPSAVREIPAGAFKGCRALRVVSAPGALRVGPLAFAACPELVAVTTAGEPVDLDPWAFVDSPRAHIRSLPRVPAEPPAPGDRGSLPPSPLPSDPAARPPDHTADAAAGAWRPSASEAESRIAQRFGAPSAALVRVVDADGAPVPGAWVAWRFPAPEHRAPFGVEAAEGLARADSNGVARAEAEGFGVFEAALVDPATGMRFGWKTARGRAPGEPFELALADTPASRELGARTGKRSWWSDAEGWRSEAYEGALLDDSAVEALFDLGGAPVGLDLARRAFLPPLGDGETADCFLRAFRHWPEDSGLALEGIEVMQNAQCTMHNVPTSPHSAFGIPHSAFGISTNSLYLRALPPWSNGRRRRVGHLLPPPCSWSSTNGWTGPLPAPWRAVSDSTPLRVPVRSRGAEGWVEIGPGGTLWSGLHVSGFLPVESRPFARPPGAEECRIWRGPLPARGFLAIGKTVDGAACLFGPCAPEGGPCAPSAFSGAARIALSAQSSDAPQFLAGIDTLVVPSFVGEVPDHAFENCGDLRCVVLEPGVRRIGARAFAGCTNLAAVLRVQERAGDKVAFPDVAPDALADCAAGLAWHALVEPAGDDAPFWRRTPRGLSYAGPRILDGWLWRAAAMQRRSGGADFVRLSDSTLPPGTLSLLPPTPSTSSIPPTPSSIQHSAFGIQHLIVPPSLCGHPVHDFDGTALPETVETLELPPGLRRADLPNHLPRVVRSSDPATEIEFHDREPQLLFFPPGRYWWYPFGVNVGLTRLLPAFCDLGEQMAVRHQNRDDGGWLWVPVGDDAAQLVGYRGPDPTNGLLRLPAFVSSPSTSSTPSTRGAPRRVVSVSAWMFRRPDASAQRERGARFTLEIPEGVEEIGAFAFENTLRIELVRLPTTLRALGTGAFANCGNLKAIDLPEGVAEIPAGCFLGCAALERVAAPGARSADALAFAGCERLGSLRLAPGAAIHPSALLDTPALR